MGELRRDPVNGRWIIVTTDNPKKPSDFDREANGFKPGPCPFCYGNEHLTPTEIEAIRHEDTQPNTPGWLVRTVANKFPALRIEGNLDRKGIGLYDMLNGIGAHEVIIESPYHDKDMTDLTDEEVTNVIRMYCRRALDLQKDERLKYILIFKNYGPGGGATLEHPHTQLIALPMAPKNALEELHGASSYFTFHERCVFCDILNQELEEKIRILIENKYFVSFCPFVSRFSFEVRIMPKTHESNFCKMKEEEKESLAIILKQTLIRLRSVLGEHSYNFIFHSAPVERKNYDYYHWYVEIMPRLSRIAGFEWGTGFYVQPTPPELAAQYLKNHD